MIPRWVGVSLGRAEYPQVSPPPYFHRTWGHHRGSLRRFRAGSGGFSDRVSQGFEVVVAMREVVGVEVQPYDIPAARCSECACVRVAQVVAMRFGSLCKRA